MDRPTLCVVMPVFNEEPYVAECLRRVFERGRPDQVIVVDDGSTDETYQAIASSSYAERIELLRHRSNRGKGASIRTALPHVQSEVVIIQDGDLEYDPADYDRLLDAMGRTGSPAVYGSRYLGNNPHSTVGFYLGGRAMSALANRLFGLRLTDVPTCYKLLRTELLRRIPLRADRFEFCAEVTGYLGRTGIAVSEVPIRYTPRSKAEGKKITPLDGLRSMATLCLVRIRSPRRACPPAG
ncbi:MAG: glycosyltransferase family 2 protein [Deltaproteobacteria bacterium]|jgi:glycosyltransferase involved in cell wall biosynthesis|nr:glycosyltransferase family 2 protein [Deltaproteobacteria bacterium]MBW2533854.1 glycosyltransferase family 2 protein [Deltaproteobacteria bacterium]